MSSGDMLDYVNDYDSDYGAVWAFHPETAV
jgi:hypothetical protein